VTRLDDWGLSDTRRLKITLTPQMSKMATVHNHHFENQDDAEAEDCFSAVEAEQVTVAAVAGTESELSVE